MSLSAQGVALVAWVGASVAQVEALSADLMYLDASLVCLVSGLVLHVHGLVKKSCRPFLASEKLTKMGVTHLCLPSYFCVDLRQITQVCEHGFFQQITAVTFHCESVAHCRR